MADAPIPYPILFDCRFCSKQALPSGRMRSKCQDGGHDTYNDPDLAFHEKPANVFNVPLNYFLVGDEEKH